jgi:tryptophanyl-tRNA synthetase
MAIRGRPRAFTGIQPTGDLHLGNYLGALVPWIRAQDEVDGFFAVVDLHALTSLPDPARLRDKTREVAALALAAGVDPERTTVFVQSHVPEHVELAWLLECLCPAGWLLRMIQYRDRVARGGGEGAGTGLLVYPVLMAADILLYDADVVPVGEDQRQHLELVRMLARRLVDRYGAVVRVPEARVSAAGARVMGLDDPARKMSKSVRAPNHAVRLLDPPERVRRVVARAVTDSEPGGAYDPAGRPAVANLLRIEAALAGEPVEETAARFAGRGHGELKRALADRIVAHLEPLQARYRELASRPGELDAILARGAERARAAASVTLRRIADAAGLVAPLR